MNKYEVTITETLERKIEVEAESAEEAQRMVKDGWENSDYILLPDDFSDVNALLFIRGERPIKDLKYDILKHPNVKDTTDGQGKTYSHGFDDYAVLEMDCFDKASIDTADVTDADYVVYSSDEIEELLLKMEE